MTNYNDKLTQDYGVIRAKVRRGMLPLVARNPAIEKAVGEYAVAQADYYDAARAKAVAGGRSPDLVPVPYRDSDALDRFADLIMREELTWSHPDKMSIVAYPVMSDRQEQSARGRYAPNSDLQYGDRRFTGRRKTHFTDDKGAPQVRNSRVVDPRDVVIDAIGEYDALYDALDNAGLTDRQRQAIELVYFGNEGDGMTQAEAGKAMGIRKPAVNEHVEIALRKLREYMTKD